MIIMTTKECSAVVGVWKERETDLLGEFYLSKGKLILPTNCAIHFIPQYLVEYTYSRKKTHVCKWCHIRIAI